MADASSAKLLKDSSGLRSALEKLHKDVSQHPLRLGNQATSSLFIMNPFKAGGIAKLMSTHPPFQERVKRLKEMD